MPRQNNIQFRKGSYSQWDANSTTVLGSGEPGFATDINILKIGDGTKQWSDLQAINESLITIVRNDTGSTINKMSVVYINGAQGDTPRIALGIASGEGASSKTYGLTVNNISNGGTGIVVVDGTLRNLDTNTQFSTLSEGTALWLSPTVSGGITSSKPYAPNHSVFVGTLIRKHSQQGVINVKIQNGYELEELHNVATTGATNGQFLQYNSGSGLWFPSSSGNFNSLSINGISAATDNSSIVRTTGDQTIGGNKTFADGLTVGNNVGNFLAGTSGVRFTHPQINFQIDAGNLNPGFDGDALRLDIDGTTGQGYTTTLKTSAPGQDITVLLPNSAGTLVTDNNLLNISINAGSGLSGGGNITQTRTINIGQGDGISVSADTIAVNNTVVRTTGNQNLEGNVTIGGDLTVNGSTVITNVDTVTVEDPIITLGLSSGNIVPNLMHDRGLALVRGTGLTAFMGWDTSASQFVMLSSGIAGVNSGTYTAGTYGDLQLNKLNSAEINVNELISIISSGISFSNFIKFNDSSTASGPSLGSVSNGTRLLLNENNTDGHNAIGIQYAGINGTWFSVPSGGAFTFYNGTSSQLTLNSTSLNYGSFSINSDGSITSASWNASTIPVNKGGTGRTSYSNGQLLIGSGTSLIANTLSAGSGISITNGSGTITINTSAITGIGTSGYLAKWISGSAVSSGIIYDNGTNIGIGTTNPGYKLQVSGSFGATTKSFRIEHPSKPGFSLEYGSLESPYHGVRLTGRDKVIKGTGIVQLPDYLKDLIHDDNNLNIQITNIKHGKTIYVDSIDLKNDCFIVKADRAKSLGDLHFFWTLTGVRKDVENLVVEKRN
jgi:hypothetical protein